MTVSPARERPVRIISKNPSRRAATRPWVMDLTGPNLRITEYSPTMADTYTKILVHCVFSTKGRRPQILEPEKLWSYLRGIARNRGVDTLGDWRHCESRTCCFWRFRRV